MNDLMTRKVTRTGLIRFAGLASLAAMAAPLTNVSNVLAADDSPIRHPDKGFLMDGGFASFWHANGGLPIFGFPISNLIDERLEDGNSYKVQYTERARFEYHPKGNGQFEILLGLFGQYIYDIRFGGGAGNGGSSGSAGSPLAQQQPGPMAWPFSLPAYPNQEALPKVRIEDAPRGQWFHRVYNPDWFHAPDWGGADSWFLTYGILRETGGRFRSFRNSGQIIFRHQDSQYAEFQLAILTTAKWKEQFLAGEPGPVQMNIRTAPGAYVSLCGPDGKVRVSAQTSDMGDVSINLPDECRITVCCAYKVHDLNAETHIWFGPTGRTVDIDIINGPPYQWS